MDVHLAEATIKSYLTEIRNRLDKAAGIVALDIEQLLYETTTLLNAASLIDRMARQS